MESKTPRLHDQVGKRPLIREDGRVMRAQTVSNQLQIPDEFVRVPVRRRAGLKRRALGAIVRQNSQMVSRCAEFTINIDEFEGVRLERVSSQSFGGQRY